MNNFSYSKGGTDVYCLFFLGFLMSFSPLTAKNHPRQGSFITQQHKVQGTVTDGTNPLPGVTIAIKNKKNNAVISDYSGQFALETSPYDTLVVSFIGFKTTLVPIQGRSILNIKLSYDTTTLQEVKVNAGYYTVKESERTGNIARITSKDIETQPVTNVLATMQGRMAGVSITQTTGVPGGGFDIKIRGQNSLRTDANAPLYIIDGVPYASDPIGSASTGYTFPTVMSPLNSINPDFIESIEVLKDADATSIYGSRGANGVVLITTKKGKAGKTKFTVTASTGSGTVTRFAKLMNTEQYLTMRQQAFLNDGIQFGEYDYDVNGTWDQNRYTDWQKELLGGTAQITNLQATVSGGSENTSFMLGGTYNTQSTVFPGNFIYTKGGGQFNLNHTSSDQRFRLTFSAVLNAQKNDQPSFDLTYDARFLPPNAPSLYNSDGSLNWENSTWTNPLANLQTKFESKTNDLVTSTSLSYQFTSELAAKINMGYTNLTNNETRVVPSTVYDPAYNTTSARSAIYLNNVDRFSWIVEPQISWQKDLKDSTLDFLLGATFQNQQSERIQQNGIGFSSNSLIYNLAAAKTIRITLNDETVYKYQAFFGRLNYNFKKRYILNLTARRDGSSRFSPENQFANFGAIGAAWLFSKESFLANNSWLSFGKIRASYGTTGNDQIGDYQFLDTYTSTGVLYNGITGLAPTRLYNADFGWETNKKLEAALELGFFKDRIFATASWYQNRSSNQLVGIPLPTSTGFSSYQANLDALVQNRGFEFTLRTNNFINGSFTWVTNFNVTFSKNKLLSFPGLESSTYSQQYRIGQPLNIKLLYNYKGIDLQNGVYTFEDRNGDGTVTFPEDRQTVADFNPKYYGGVQNQLSYKGITLDFLFQFVKQKNTFFPLAIAGSMANQPQRISDSWTKAGDLASYQLYTTGYNNTAVSALYAYNESTALVTDASYIRLKNISLSYDLPLFLKSTQCRLMVQGQNLLTFTKYKDGDPEFITSGFLPPLKVLTAGVQLTF